MSSVSPRRTRSPATDGTCRATGAVRATATAQAGEVWIRLRLSPRDFILEIEDNGRGIGDQTAPQNRNGLRNMKKRMEDIRGEFSISAGTNGGTIVRLKIPLGKK